MYLKYIQCAKTCKNVQKRASQVFLDPIQKRALSRSVQLEAVYLEALLYIIGLRLNFSYHKVPSLIPAHFFKINGNHDFS